MCLGGREKWVEDCGCAGGNSDDGTEADIFVYTPPHWTPRLALLHMFHHCFPSHGLHHMSSPSFIVSPPPQALHQLREACSAQVIKALARRRGKGEAQEGGSGSRAAAKAGPAGSSSSSRAAAKGGPVGGRPSDWGAMSGEDVPAIVDQQAGEQPQRVAAVTGVTGDTASPAVAVFTGVTADAAGLAATIRVVSASTIDGPLSNGSFELANHMPLMVTGVSGSARVVTEASGNAKVMASLTRAAEVASGLRKLAERQAQAVAWAQAARKLQTGGSSSISRAEVVSGRGGVRIVWEFLCALLALHHCSWQATHSARCSQAKPSTLSELHEQLLPVGVQIQTPPRAALRELQHRLGSAHHTRMKEVRYFRSGSRSSSRPLPGPVDRQLNQTRKEEVNEPQQGLRALPIHRA